MGRQPVHKNHSRDSMGSRRRVRLPAASQRRRNEQVVARGKLENARRACCCVDGKGVSREAFYVVGQPLRWILQLLHEAILEAGCAG